MVDEVWSREYREASADYLLPLFFSSSEEVEMPRDVLTVACKEQSNVTRAASESVLDDFGQDGHDDSIDDLHT